MAINRVQIVRSSVPGNVPPPATRNSGELWLNFPDNQLGYIDVARNAQKLLPIRVFSSLANYAAGDMVVQGGFLWTAAGAITAGAFNSTQWIKNATAADVGPLAPSRRAVGDANYTILPGDSYVVTSVAFTANRTWTLPLANSVPAGYEVVICDEFKTLGPTASGFTITLQRAGSDLINNAAPSIIFGHRILERVALRSDGVSNWTQPALFGSLDGFTVGINTPAAGGFTTLVLGPSAAPLPPMGCCRLQLQDATHIVLKPYNGNLLRLNGVMYPIPLAGVVLSNATFTANTCNYIYAYWSGSAIVLENSSSVGHGQNTDGAEVKGGDATRLLVGMVGTNASAQFQDDAAHRWVLSWFNRQPKTLQNAFTAKRSTTSTSFVEISTEIRVFFLNWTDELVQLSLNGTWSNETAGATSGCGIAIDGGGGGNVVGTISAYGNAGYVPCALSEQRAASEFVAHYATIGGAVSSGTASWWGLMAGAGNFTEINGMIKG